MRWVGGEWWMLSGEATLPASGETESPPFLRQGDRKSESREESDIDIKLL